MRFFKKKTPPVSPAEPTPALPATLTHLGPSFRLNGNISGNDDVVFEGALEGNIGIQGELTLGSNVSIIGQIQADSIDMAGTADGRLSARRRLIVHSSSRIRGQLDAPSIILHASAKFDGKVTMGSPPTPPTKHRKGVIS